MNDIEKVIRTIGEGAAQYESHNVGGIELRRFTGRGDRQWRQRDLDLALQLRYRRLTKIRDLIKRLVRAKKLNDLVILPAVGRISAAGRPADEYWLTQAQALKVAAKSETEVADEILDRVIAVYQAVTQGEGLKPDRLPGGQIEDLLHPMRAAKRESDVERLSKLEETVQRLERLSRLEETVQRLERIPVPGQVRGPEAGPISIALVPAAEAGLIPATDLAALATLCGPGCTVSYACGKFQVWRGSPPVLLCSHADAFVAVQRSWDMGAPGGSMPRYIQRAIARDSMRPCHNPPCHLMIPPWRRKDAKYCSDRCKGAAGREKNQPQA